MNALFRIFFGAPTRTTEARSAQSRKTVVTSASDSPSSRPFQLPLP